MRRTVSYAMVLSSLLLAGGCGEDTLTGPSAIGGSWTLRNMQLADFSVRVIEQGFTVEFREGGELSARIDCNVCSASYEVSGESLSIGPLACTRAFCGPESLDAEYTEILTSVTRHGVDGGTLTLRSPRGTLRYTH